MNRREKQTYCLLYHYQERKGFYNSLARGYLEIHSNQSPKFFKQKTDRAEGGKIKTN